MTIRKQTLNYVAVLVAALGVLLAWLAFAPPAGAQGNSGADQYLENVPNPSGEKPGDKDNKGGGKSGGGSSGGSDGSGGSSGSGGSPGSGGSYGEDETEDALREPGKRAADDQKRADQDPSTPGVQNGDRASADVPSSAITPPDDGGDGGGPSGGLIAFTLVLLLGPVAFLLYRRLTAGRRNPDTV